MIAFFFATRTHQVFSSSIHTVGCVASFRISTSRSVESWFNKAVQKWTRRSGCNTIASPLTFLSSSGCSSQCLTLVSYDPMILCDFAVSRNHKIKVHKIDAIFARRRQEDRRVSGLRLTITCDLCQDCVSSKHVASHSTWEEPTRLFASTPEAPPCNKRVEPDVKSDEDAANFGHMSRS